MMGNFAFCKKHKSTSCRRGENLLNRFFLKEFRRNFGNFHALDFGAPIDTMWTALSFVPGPALPCRLAYVAKGGTVGRQIS